MAGGSVGFVTYRYYPLGIAFTPVPQKAQQKSRLRKSRMSAIKTREASGSPSFLDDGVVQHRGLPLSLTAQPMLRSLCVTSLRSPDHARKARRCEEKTEVGTRAPKQPNSIPGHQESLAARHEVRQAPNVCQ